MKGVPSCADGDEASGQRLVARLETDEAGEFPLDVFQPVADGLLLVEQVVRVAVLQRLLDHFQFAVQLRLEVEQLARDADQRAAESGRSDGSLR